MNEGADACRRVNTVVGSLEIALTYPKVCSILQVLLPSDKVPLETLGVSAEPGGARKRQRTRDSGVVVNQLQLLLAQPGGWAVSGGSSCFLKQP